MTRKIIYTYGKPKAILTDNGGEFTGDEFQVYLRRNGIQHDLTAPYHPQTNGKVERFNAELVRRLEKLTNGNDWDIHLDQALFAIHAHERGSSGYSAFYLAHGREPILPSQATKTLSTNPVTAEELRTVTAYRAEHIQDLERFRTEAAQKYHDAFERLASGRDENYIERAIKPGDVVMRKVGNRLTKLWPKWDGPFVIVSCTETNNYQLGTANGYILRKIYNLSQIRKLSAKELKQYHNEFWSASERLKIFDLRVKRENEKAEKEESERIMANVKEELKKAEKARKIARKQQKERARNIRFKVVYRGKD